MPFVSDYTKLPKQIIYDLIGAMAGLPLSDDLVELGLPALALNPASPRSTEIIVSAKPGSGFVGSKTLAYNRIDFAAIPGARSVGFPRGSATTIAQLVPAINARYKLNLQPEDYVDGPLPNYVTGEQNESLPFTLTAKPDSYCFVGSVEMAIVHELDRRNLATVLGPSPGLISAAEFTLPTILQDLRDNYGIEIESEDLEYFLIPETGDGEFHQVPLVATINSPRWYGSTTLTLAQYDVDPLGVLVHETAPAALP